MELLLSCLQELKEYNQLKNHLLRGKTAGVSGVAQINRSHLIASLYRDCGKPMAILCQDELAASRLSEELGAFLNTAVPALPIRDLSFYDSDAASGGWQQRRLRALYDFSEGTSRLLILSWEAASLRTMPRETLRQASVTIRPGDTLDTEELSGILTRAGYTRCELVEGVGQYAMRGGIVDVFSPSMTQPVRIELFGDEVDTMGSFDTLTQRRTENTDSIVILPVRETVPCLHPSGVAGLTEELRALLARQRRRKNPNEALLRTLTADIDTLESGAPFYAADRYMSLIYPEFRTAADYFPEDTVLVFSDHGNLRRAANGSEEDTGMQLDSYLQSGLLAGELCDFRKSWDEFCGDCAGFTSLFLDSFLASAYPADIRPTLLTSFTAKQLPAYGGSLETAAADLENYQRHGYRCLVLCGSENRAKLFSEFPAMERLNFHMQFPAKALPQPGEIILTDGNIPAGMEYPEIKLAVLSEGQLLHRAGRKAKTSRKKVTNRQKLNSFADLTPGDLVVHEHHGIGRYLGMEQIRVDGAVKDYVKIAYQGADVLYVPATSLDVVSKYIGAGEDAAVKLNKLGGDAWEKTKSRAKAAVKDLAEGLIKLYAERKRMPGYAFSADSPWQREFEEGFGYAETDDQLRCIEEIKSDMETPRPMDRLLCGDVGFGKTEVALRAAMKAILDGKQVAILVPTTVLAQQHYATATGRFSGFPVNIEVLSRFRTALQQKRTLAGLAAGTVDLVIGTHKLLQKSIVFKNLGLLIVDEEQRFGVTHKERLKELSKGIDVLTLSATPIPRTLNMALSGIRDMSTIEEPPQDRYPVQTFVLEYSEPVVDDAIRRELGRRGQVYYLHNRVENIEQCAGRLRARHPEAEIAVAHGKMNEEQLGDVMQRMADGEIDILVCSTIIETGIDIPNVNTLIIEDADKLGLAQLHQLRGRVGRSARHAFAYLTFRRGKVLTEVAEKRLNAIREYAEFGSGFKIAMRDLEIRGAGNLLGAEQSGHLLSVGYDLYLKLLEEAVLEEQGETRAETVDCTADINITANIDKSYIPSGEQRMDLYRRMAAIRSREDADELLDEIVDRYSDPPKGVMNLIDIALLRADAASVGITEIAQKGTNLLLTWKSADFEMISELCSDRVFRGRSYVQPKSVLPAVRIMLRPGEDVLKTSRYAVKLCTGWKERQNV